jgi:hypothetical protein
MVEKSLTFCFTIPVQVGRIEPSEMIKVIDLLADNILWRVRKENMISQTRKAAIGMFKMPLRTESGRSAP